MKFPHFFLCLLTLIGATSTQIPLGGASPLSDVRTNVDPRLVMYVQTFTTPDKKPLSLLPLLEHDTKVTHIILASLHLHEEPGVMRLNNDPLDSPVYEIIWEEVKTLQKSGVKVMALLGGAAAGSYMRLNGTDEEVSFFFVPF